jgi:hypothetical protein
MVRATHQKNIFCQRKVGVVELGLATDFDADERAHLSASNDMIILIQDFVSNQFVPFAMKVLFAVQRPPVFVDLRAIELDEVVVI